MVTMKQTRQATHTTHAKEGTAMRDKPRRSIWSRGALAGLAAGLTLLLAGDRPAQTALIGGIDPLQVMDLEIRNNVLFIFDTSGSMKWPLDFNNFTVGGDDPMSRMWQAKQAVRAVVDANRDRLNFGIASYAVEKDDKRLNQNQAWGSNRANGPLIYVSPDAAADVFYQVYDCSEGTNNGVSKKGFFCGASNTFGDYDGATYPAGCTPGDDCRYYMDSRLFRGAGGNGVRFTWDLTSTDSNTRLLSTTNIGACPAPPAGFLSNDDPNRPCFQMQAGAGGPIATFYYTSAIFENISGVNCGGALALSNVSDCDDLAGQLAAIADIEAQTELELPLPTVNAALPLLGPNLMNGDFPTPLAGLRTDQSTPLAGSLDDVRTAGTPMFPPRPGPVAAFQRNYVILLTDGDDTCASRGGYTGTDGENYRALEAARAAEDLYDNEAADPEHGAETMVVAFTSAVNADRANWIARGGSGGEQVGSGATATFQCTGSSPASCRNAFLATSLDELIAVLNEALEITLGTGELAAAGSAVATVFELGPIGNEANCVRSGDPNPSGDPICVDPLEPNTRYNRRANAFYQPTFDLPMFDGHLYAFLRDGTFMWDAGQVLDSRVSVGTGGVPFASLPGLISRRVFTSDPTPAAGDPAFSPVNISYQEPVDADYTAYTSRSSWDAGTAGGNNVVALWPPDQTGLGNGIGDIDPAAGTAGPLDDVLGIGDIDPETGLDWTIDPGTGVAWVDPTEGPRRHLAFLKRDFEACEVTADAGFRPSRRPARSSWPTRPGQSSCCRSTTICPSGTPPASCNTWSATGSSRTRR